MHTQKPQLINNQYDDQINIADHIINGSIEIHSIETFKGIIKRYPDNWVLLRIYADMLQKKGLNDTAAKSYAKASKHSLKANKILEFIVLKLLQWRISPPKKLEAQRVMAELKRNMDRGTPLETIFSKLSFQEMIAILSRFEIVHFPAGQVIKRLGDLEDNLYFVVSGTLRDSIFLTIENNEKIYRKPTLYLSENDFFGDIYPFEKENKCKSYIESMKQVVLIKISQTKLIQVCQKYPKIEFGLMDLFKIRTKVCKSDSPAKLRGSQRFQLTLNLNLMVYPKTSPRESINLNGLTSDISISGMCFILDEKSYNLSLNDAPFSDTIYDAKAQINLSVESLALNVAGIVAWSREISFEGRKTLALGIQFETLSPKWKGILIALFNGIKRI